MSADEIVGTLNAFLGSIHSHCVHSNSNSTVDHFDIDSINALIFCTGYLMTKLHLIRYRISYDVDYIVFSISDYSDNFTLNKVILRFLPSMQLNYPMTLKSRTTLKTLLRLPGQPMNTLSIRSLILSICSTTKMNRSSSLSYFPRIKIRKRSKMYHSSYNIPSTISPNCSL